MTDRMPPEDGLNEQQMAYLVQRNNRQKTRRQIAYIQRRLDHETLTTEQRQRLEDEQAALQARFREGSEPVSLHDIVRTGALITDVRWWLNKGHITTEDGLPLPRARG